MTDEQRIAELEDELAKLRELYADRDMDLEYEYTERMAAEARCEAWYQVAQYATHDNRCPGNPCRCGLAGIEDQAYRTLPVTTPHAVLVRLGRATLVYERRRGTPEVRDARGEFLAALEAAERAEEARG